MATERMVNIWLSSLDISAGEGGSRLTLSIQNCCYLVLIILPIYFHLLSSLLCHGPLGDWYIIYASLVLIDHQLRWHLIHHNNIPNILMKQLLDFIKLLNIYLSLDVTLSFDQTHPCKRVLGPILCKTICGKTGSCLVKYLL